MDSQNPTEVKVDTGVNTETGLIDHVPGMEAPAAPAVETGKVVPIAPEAVTPEMLATQAKREEDARVAAAAAESVVATSAAQQKQPLAPLAPNAVSEMPGNPVAVETPVSTPTETVTEMPAAPVVAETPAVPEAPVAPAAPEAPLL